MTDEPINQQTDGQTDRLEGCNSCSDLTQKNWTELATTFTVFTEKRMFLFTLGKERKILSLSDAYSSGEEI